jgi:hypothetical protein
MPHWASDAMQMIELSAELEKVVHRTKVLDGFLDGDKKFFLCASKGMGKTLLLSCKRYRLESGLRRMGQPPTPSGIRFVPSPKPYLDVMGDLPSLSRAQQETYSSIENAKKVWSLALRLSALSHLGSTELGTALPEPLATDIRSAQGIAPTEVFHILVQLPVSRVHGIYDGSYYEIDRAFRRIQSKLAMFIDRVDQALMGVGKQTWIHLQAGLIEAAWDAMSTNSHLSVYATIRQEAFSSYTSPTRSNLKTAVTELSYDDEDLRQLLDRLTNEYENARSFVEFTGVTTVDNKFADLEEDAYRYLYRHTIGRPRDLVQIAEELSNQRKITEGRYREIVNRAAAPIVGQVFDELGVFLEALRSEEDRRRFFSMIPRNVLTRREIESISRKFNGVNVGDSYAAEEVRHPFCELYATGLLGVLREVPEARVEQRFKRPSDAMSPSFGDLVHSEFYLLHPALEDALKRARGDYEVLRFAAVGQGYPWPRKQTDIVMAQCELQKILCNGSEGIQRERKQNLKPKVIDVLRMAHECRSEDDRSPAHQFTTEAVKAWTELLSILTGSQEYKDLLYWLERAVAGCT